MFSGRGFKGKTHVAFDEERLNFVMHNFGNVAFEIYRLGCFEKNETSFVVESVHRGAVFVDIGANTGYFSLLAVACGAGRVLAIEPTSATYNALKKNIALNGFHVETARVALSDRTGTAQLNVNVRGKDGLNTLGDATHPQAQIAGTEVVQLSTLDEILAERGVSKVDFLKIDTEGAELQILRGASQLLSRHDAPMILFESNPDTARGFGYDVSELDEILHAHGYQTRALNTESRIATKN